MTDRRTVNDLLEEWSLDERDLGGGKTPKEFYLVFDIPSTDSDPFKWAKEIKAGFMKGVVGVSANPEIIELFRYPNGLLVMDGEEFIKINKLSRVQYDNPHYLVQDNLAALYRIWNQNPKSSAGVHALISSVGRHLIDMSSGKFKNAARRCLMHEMAAYYIKDHPHKFKGVADLTNWFYDTFNELFKTVKEHSWDMAEEISRAMFKDWMMKSLAYFGESLPDEEEWIIKDRNLKIPKKTKIYYMTEQVELNYLMKEFPKLTGLKKDQADTYDFFIKDGVHLEQAKTILKGFKFKIVTRERLTL